MEFNETYTLNAYHSTVENFEYTESLCHHQQRSYPAILEELKNCCSKIEFLISLETDHTLFLVALYQQKEQVTMLIDIVSKLVQEEVNSMNKWLTGHKAGSNFPSQTTDIKKNKCEDNELSMTIIASTLQIPRVNGLSEIVGLYDLKKLLKSLILLPKTQPQLFINRRLCNSLLLFGPPGTGKTRLAHALAAEGNAILHCISASDVLSHYVGQTEKNIKVLFQHLKDCGEFCVLFIDEIDAFCRKRNANEHEHTRRIKTELMCQMTNIEECKTMFLICATNCPWELDPAILRRFQKRVYVPLPNPFERLELFQYFSKKLQIGENFDNWTFLCHKTEGYSGSDIYNAFQTASTIPLMELQDTKIWKFSNDGFYEPVMGEQDLTNVICSELNDLPPNSVKARQIRMVDLLNAVDSLSCTVSSSEVKKYDDFIKI